MWAIINMLSITFRATALCRQINSWLREESVYENLRGCPEAGEGVAASAQPLLRFGRCRRGYEAVRIARIAAAMSGAPKTLVPATSVSAPASMLVLAVVALIPPSTSMR